MRGVKRKGISRRIAGIRASLFFEESGPHVNYQRPAEVKRLQTIKASERYKRNSMIFEFACVSIAQAALLKEPCAWTKAQGKGKRQ
jgi:hypothetical protein